MHDILSPPTASEFRRVATISSTNYVVALSSVKFAFLALNSCEKFQLPPFSHMHVGSTHNDAVIPSKPMCRIWVGNWLKLRFATIRRSYSGSQWFVNHYPLNYNTWEISSSWTKIIYSTDIKIRSENIPNASQSFSK